MASCFSSARVRKAEAFGIELMQVGIHGFLGLRRLERGLASYDGLGILDQGAKTVPVAGSGCRHGTSSRADVIRAKHGLKTVISVSDIRISLKHACIVLNTDIKSFSHSECCVARVTHFLQVWPLASLHRSQ